MAQHTILWSNPHEKWVHTLLKTHVVPPQDWAKVHLLKNSPCSTGLMVLVLGKAFPWKSLLSFTKSKISGLAMIHIVSFPPHHQQLCPHHNGHTQGDKKEKKDTKDLDKTLCNNIIIWQTDDHEGLRCMFGWQWCPDREKGIRLTGPEAEQHSLTPALQGCQPAALNH